MRVALGVPRVQSDRQANLAAIEEMTAAAASTGAQLILFSEAALTGFINNDDPAHDLPLGQPIPGPVTVKLARSANAHQIWIAVGLLERTGKTLYDSAILLAPDGTIALTYRRIDPCWHAQSADPAIYRQGTSVAKASTPLGISVFLLCGDLFNTDCRQQLQALAPDWLLFPMARGFDQDVADAEQWHAQERYFYVRQAQALGVNMLVANQLADNNLDAQYRYFGGAMVVSKGGQILASLPLHQEGVLIADVQ